MRKMKYRIKVMENGMYYAQVRNWLNVFSLRSPWLHISDHGIELYMLRNPLSGEEAARRAIERHVAERERRTKINAVAKIIDVGWLP